MEIKAKRGDLLATLYWTQSIVERRNTMPILGNVLIEAKKNAYSSHGDRLRSRGSWAG